MDTDRRLEYQCLRSDIERIDNNTFNVLKFSIGACFAIVTFGITQDNALAALVPPLVILIFGYCLVLENAGAITRRAAYLRTFVEQDDPSAGYERRLFALRQRFRPQSQYPKIHGGTVFWMFALSGLLTVALVVLVFATDRAAWIASGVALAARVGVFYFLGRWRRWAEAGGELDTTLSSALKQVYGDEMHQGEP